MSAPSSRSSSLSRSRALELMAYVDGELGDEELAEVEALLASDPEAARLANDLANLGELIELGAAASPSAKAIASFDVADAVMAKIAETKPDAKPVVARVASLDAARARQRRQLKIGGAVAAALALAASVFLLTRTKEIPMGGGPVAEVKTAPTGTQAPPHESTPELVAQSQPTTPTPSTTSSTAPSTIEVDAVGSPGNSVSVFYLPNERELTTSVVVWVDETGEK